MAEARKSEDEITEWGQESERESGDGFGEGSVARDYVLQAVQFLRFPLA